MWRTQKYRSLIKTETGNRAARFRVTGHYLRSVFTSTTATLALTQFVLPTAHAGASFSNGALPDWLTTDPLTIGFAGLTAVTITAVLWAARLSRASKNLSADWSRRLTMMEAKLEKTDAVLAAHPGLVLVWEDDHQAIDSGWGDPRILGGPAAMASLLSFSSPQPDREAPIPQKNESPVAHLLETLGDLPVEDDAEETKNLREKIHDLRAHGVSFSGAIVTLEGRAIEADGRVAGSQVTLWLTDPAARMAEDDGVMGKVRERTIDLHGALSLLEKSLMPAWRRDSDYRLAWVNRAYCEAVECKYPGEVIRKQIELDPAALKIAREAGETRRRAEGQIVVNIAGERRVLRIIETPMHSGEGAAIGGIALDGTDLDRARRDLSDHLEANRRILDEIPSAVALFNADQTLAYYNQAFQDLWALEDVALAGRPTHAEFLDDLDHSGKLPERGDDYAPWRESQLALYTEDLAEPGSERSGALPDELWNLPDGRTVRVSRRRHTLGGVLVVFDDVTEKLKLETRYNTQLKVQRSTLNNLAEGVAVFSSDGQLRLHNEAFSDLWRLGRNFLADAPHIDKVGHAMSHLLPEDENILDDIKRRVISMSPEDRMPIRQREVELRDGRTLSSSTEPLPDGATLVYMLDITDSREREKELEERNEILEAVGQLKSKFADHVSHQLRTPLATIVGFTEMLESEMFGVLNDRQKDYIADILSASYHLRDLIDDVIDLTAIDAGQMTLESSEVDLRNLVESAATYAALKAEDTRVGLKVDCPKDIGSIMADEQRLKQVLFNLLSNAFAYTGAGGQVVIGADRTAEMARLWVSDTGRGVSPEDQAKAFDAFESRGPSAGVGLGLSLVERFVKLHGGWVRLESTPGVGTTVTCHLPVAPAVEGNARQSVNTQDQHITEKKTNAARSARKPSKAEPAKRKTRRSANKSSKTSAAASGPASLEVSRRPDTTSTQQAEALSVDAAE